ncbi:MAG TPA: hypothetical protein VIY96_00715, partial [Thermoanaerobaculia bacterium]
GSGGRPARAGDPESPRGLRRIPSRAAVALVFAAALGCHKPSAAPRVVSPGLAAKPPSAHAESGYSFRPGEKEAVDAFLRANRDLRVATDDDRHESESGDVKKFYGIYHPYFLRGDVNDDGVLDFVLAFVRRSSDSDSPWFSVVVFAGKETAGFRPGAFLERDVSLADGDLSVDRDSIVITPDLDDEDNTRRYRWDPIRNAYVFVSDDSEEDERAPTAQT